MNPALRPVTTPQELSPFAQVVSQLADEPDCQIDQCRDRDMRDCARLLKAARRVARMNRDALEATRAAR